LLVTDTNVLARCSRGRAMKRAVALHERGVRLSTTASNGLELSRKLVDVFEMNPADAAAETERVLGLFEVIYPESFEHLRLEAELRLSAAGKSDWPALAAAMAFDGAIWSDDRDYFGVGVPVWSSGNVLLAAGE